MYLCKFTLSFWKQCTLYARAHMYDCHDFIMSKLYGKGRAHAVKDGEAMYNETTVFYCSSLHCASLLFW